MGLDIYTYTKAEHDAEQAFETKWGDAESLTGEQSKQWSEEFRALGGSQDVKSERFPDNINNRRYLRSSYNEGGFNSVVPEVTGDERFSYYGILDPLRSDEEYVYEVRDLDKIAEARSNAERCVQALEVLGDSPIYRVDSQNAATLRPQNHGGPLDKAGALRVFLETKRDHKDSSFGAFSNSNGSFYLKEPLEVVATMPGKDFMGACVHVVYQTKLHSSYVESAHVLVEFCDELADLVKRDGVAYIHWSG